MPAGQALQLDEPGISEYDPALHAEHCEEPAKTAYLPGKQVMQTYELFAASTEANVPAGQLAQFNVPGTSEYVPLLHCKHLEAPLIEECVPGGQFLHSEEPTKFE